jgi:1-acyl-sn-glycerol-3-phosphate acyltransferase
VGVRAAAIVLAGIPSTAVIPLPLTQLVTRRFRREDLLKRIHFMVPWARFCARRILEVDLDVRGREHLPRRPRGYLYVSNHQSYVDILILMEALDTAAFLSKKLIRYFPVLGRCAYCGGTVFMERGEKASRQAALEETLRMCQESTPVVVFPEGTRSADGELREKIHPRAMHEAWRRGLRVIPVGLHGSHRVFPRTMDRLNLGERVAVRIGEPLDPACFQDGEALAEACWGAVTELHREAKGAVLSGSR